jgi:membrane protease YdiL (CAAX protease family)
MLPLVLRKDTRWLTEPKKMFSASFPWFPTLVSLCLAVAFLHTMHILLSGIDTWGVFQPMWFGHALAAAVIEELAFRGFLFNHQAAVCVVKKAAAINGILFAIYHFPEFLIGQNLMGLLSFRFWMIAVMGFLFSCTFAKWKHLGMPMLIHFVWNILCYWFALV